MRSSSRLFALVLVLSPLEALAAAPLGQKVLRREEVTEDASAELQVEAQRTRGEAIDRLTVLLREGDHQPDVRAEMMMRLAELYVETADEAHRAEMKAYLAAADACDDTPRCDPTAVKPDHADSLRAYVRAIKLYRRVTTDAPGFPRADEATYFLAQALLAQADATGEDAPRTEAITELGRVLRNYGGSEMAPAAALLIGEHWFDRGEVARALPAYQRAAAKEGWAERDFARYKLAWCWYNLGEYRAALDTMKLVAGNPAEGARAVSLKEEALKDLVRFYADAGDIDGGEGTLIALGRADLVRGMLVQLAELYLTQGRWESANTMFRRVIAAQPDAPDAPQMAASIVKAMRSIGRDDDTFEELQRLRSRYGTRSDWARANAGNPAALVAADAIVERELRSFALDLHGRRGHRASRPLAMAAATYEAWLTDYSGSERAYAMRYGHAEALYALKRHSEAYTEYMAVVALNPQGEHSRFCAEAAIFAAREAKGADAVLLTALDQYINLYPEDPKKVQAMLYQAGYLHYEAGDLKSASERFRAVIAMNPATSQAEQAAHLILDGLASKTEWATLREVALAFRDQPGLGSPGFKTEVDEIAQNATLRGISERLAATGDKPEAIFAYRAFDKEFPASPKAATALHNRAVYAQQLDYLPEVVAARLALIQRFPRSAHVPESIAALGYAYESMADFARAADWYERLGALDVAGAPDALYSAAIFRAALGQPAAALAGYRALERRWPGRTGVGVEVARLTETVEGPAAGLKAWLALVDAGDTDQRMYARLRAGSLMPAGGRPGWWLASLVWFQTVVAAPHGEIARDAAAQMAYQLVEPDFAVGMALRIDGPGAGRVSVRQANALVARQLAAKVQAVSALQRRYQEVVSYGSTPWGIAASVQMGTLSENTADAILTSWVPTHLTADQQELYRMGLQDLAWPSTERAWAYYDAAATRAAEVTFQSDATVLAAERLTALRPDFPRTAPETLPAPRFLASSAVVASYERE